MKYKLMRFHTVLKEEKSTADGCAKRMVTSVPLCIMLVFQIIYNSIPRHLYPGVWRTTIVNAIFNKLARSGHTQDINEKGKRRGEEREGVSE